jgi:hypothetical protein
VRLSPQEAAVRFVNEHFPNCMLAVLGGSASTSDYNDDSDLDIVIVKRDEHDFFRKILTAYDWTIECIVITSDNYRELFDEGIHRANPGLQRMISDGMIILADEEGLAIREEARSDLAYGPMPWSSYEVEYARYMISDFTMDLSGARNACERWFIVNRIVQLISELILRSQSRWVGEGKHLYRALSDCSPELTAQLESSLKSLYTENDAGEFIGFCKKVLEPYGGLGTEGYEA